MSTNTLSKEAEIRLLNFFTDRIDPLSMAKAIRLVNFNLALNVMNDQHLSSEKALRDSFTWLNELAETLNPYLDLE
ncbi:hypothetical protein [Flavobacterium hungaricum]|uniref:Uncharacterized protein n=1 Tax=Flavobacterium hungaricum TaxID=2082725 RepID=A0ABR9TSJ2_9FLAO|nr:hypothetical protein [Flavobacterium hungaricum]MBE8728281.1 hypothetical protein [Flavobacterium hungaricum]